MKKEVIKNMNNHNVYLSEYACPDSEAIRLINISLDFRTSFFRDIDKVIYSLSYVRYADKTQVFSNVKNDMISKRMTHVQLVSKIARTIGRALALNEDLIEAACLGHDLGHVPFGHVGEKILSDISVKCGEGYFNHSVQSVRTLMCIENQGLGNNLSVQVLDAIFCHNGEVIKGVYEPVSKTVDKFLYEYSASYYDKSILKSVRPMTLEGCVLRISDVIAYIGKDIDDAIRLGIVKDSDVPSNIKSILGSSNSEIINTIVSDIVSNSIGKNYIKISDNIFKTMNELMSFNYENIYLKANTDDDINNYKLMFNKLFDLYCTHIKDNMVSEDIFTLFLNDMNDDYNNESVCRRVIDYIACMTDDFFMYQYSKYFENKKNIN